MAVGGLASSGAKRKVPKKFLCGINQNDCIGSNTSLSSGLRKNCKAHGSPEQVFKCQKNYYLKQGYKQIGPREFFKEGEYIVVLNKKSKATLLRPGKMGRYMPRRYSSKKYSATGGVII